ncbi:Xylanase inhibitor, C-terminal [Dillenia turbinata]|uniref:Xylanase inhibitor, C-terminal n=1 Tax=Dillenia turbinata TaxID=194707 RepID=A0AAN8ZK71_9MAGN
MVGIRIQSSFPSCAARTCIWSCISYRLRPLRSNEPAFTFLRVGSEMPRSPNLVSTHLIRHRDPRHIQYYVNLVGISINNQAFKYSPRSIALKPSGKGGCLIDSGCTMGYLVKRAYSKLKRAPKEHFSTIPGSRTTAYEGIVHAYSSPIKAKSRTKSSAC